MRWATLRKWRNLFREYDLPEPVELSDGYWLVPAACRERYDFGIDPATERPQRARATMSCKCQDCGLTICDHASTERLTPAERAVIDAAEVWVDDPLRGIPRHPSGPGAVLTGCVAALRAERAPKPKYRAVLAALNAAEPKP